MVGNVAATYKLSERLSRFCDGMTEWENVGYDPAEVPREWLLSLAEQARNLEQLLQAVLDAVTSENWIGLGSPLEAAINDALGKRIDLR